MTQKPLTGKDIEYLLMIAQDCVSLNTPVRAPDGMEDGELGDFLVDPSPSIEDIVIEKDKNTLLIQYIEKYLSPREEKIIKLRYGLEDGIYKTLDEVAKMYNLTRERIRQLEMSALKKLRNQFRKHGIDGGVL